MQQAIRVTALLCAGAVCCFGGYRLRRGIVTLGGLLGGLALGFVLAQLLGLAAPWWGMGLAAALGIALGLGAYRLHQLGLFVLCGACTLLLVRRTLLLYAAATLAPWMIWAAAAVLGLLVGWLVYRWRRPVVIVTTALFGGVLLADTVFALLSPAAAVQSLGQAVGLATAIGGAALQFRGPR